MRLDRRGVAHGTFAVARGAELDLSDAFTLAQCAELWSESRAIPLPGALTASVRALAPAIRASRAMFQGVRRGASFQDDVWRRLARNQRFRPAGATVDLGDQREIEKVFADAVRGRRRLARDLYAKLSWIAHDERDTSLRIRFSFGSEALLDWQGETRRAPFADAYADAVFPECAALARNLPLLRLIERMIGRRARLSERIVYSNAPGGGATFHHDDEPHQLGVVYGQLAGETAWLALPKRELARHVAHFTGSTRAKALRALDREEDATLGKLLNATPRFTRALAAAGVLFHLRAGDALLLPSHGPDDVCWHSVFALGARPSLAHSYGIFALRR